MLEVVVCVIAIILVVILYYVMKIYYSLVAYEQFKELRNAAELLAEIENQPSKKRPQVKTPDAVPELAPETIAPHLRKPPKSSGFGSKANGNRQSESGDGSESGGIKAPSPDVLPFKRPRS